MLMNIPKIISPELLKILSEMGHGDEIVIADANFPAENFGSRVIRADGVGGASMLEAVLTLLPLDRYAAPNFFLMDAVRCDDANPVIWDEYRSVASSSDNCCREGKLERFAFYERAKQAYAIIATGEEAIYANIIIKKGVIK